MSDDLTVMGLAPRRRAADGAEQIVLAHERSDRPSNDVATDLAGPLTSSRVARRVAAMPPGRLRRERHHA